MKAEKQIPTNNLKRLLIEKAIAELETFKGDKEHAEAILTLVETYLRLYGKM